LRRACLHPGGVATGVAWWSEDPSADHGFTLA